MLPFEPGSSIHPRSKRTQYYSRARVSATSVTLSFVQFAALTFCGCRLARSGVEFARPLVTPASRYMTPSRTDFMKLISVVSGCYNE
jgi:hypothetical protein